MLYVDPAMFERQLWAIQRLGLRGVSMSEGLPRLRDKTRSDLVILTFDDGYTDTLNEAAPLLRALRLSRHLLRRQRLHRRSQSLGRRSHRLNGKR